MLAFVWFAYQSETNGGQVRKMSLGFVQLLVLPRWQEYYPRAGTKTWLWCSSPRILQGLGEGGGGYERGGVARGRQKVLEGAATHLDRQQWGREVNSSVCFSSFCWEQSEVNIIYFYRRWNLCIKSKNRCYVLFKSWCWCILPRTPATPNHHPRRASVDHNCIMRLPG